MRRRWIFFSLAVLAFGCAVFLAWRDIGRAERYNVIVLTAESFRAEAVTPEIMPKLWKAAGEGLRFTEHRGVSAWTGTGAVSLLTGLHPARHAVHARSHAVPAGWTLPLEQLAGAGWRVAGLQPFQKIDIFRNIGLSVEDAPDPLSWLVARAREARPFALWYHYLDTHLPYRPEPPYRPDWQALLPTGDATSRQRIETVLAKSVIPAGSVAFEDHDRDAVRALYLGGVRQFDAWFGRFWDMLESSGLRRRTIVVFTADHGEELLERGQVGHASTTRQGHLYEEILRLPLIIWLPPELDVRPAVVDRPTDHLDVMPTVLARLGMTPIEALRGRDLLADAPVRTSWTAMTSTAGYAEADPAAIGEYRFAVLQDGWKLHLTERQGRVVSERLYELATDPNEQQDLAADIRRRWRRCEPRWLPRWTAGVGPTRRKWPRCERGRSANRRAGCILNAAACSTMPRSVAMSASHGRGRRTRPIACNTRRAAALPPCRANSALPGPARISASSAAVTGTISSYPTARSAFASAMRVPNPSGANG